MRRSHRLAQATAAALALCAIQGLPASANAAESAPQVQGEASQEASTSPETAKQAKPAASQPAQMGEIVVTARRREENARDVPIALSVIDGSQIDESGYSNLQDLYRQAPSLKVVDTNPRNVNMTIRGLGANLASESLVNSVGVFVDGVYYARPGAAAFDLLDIERMEVLRGPQGTLFGKNTTAGALNITTRAPSFDPEVLLQESVGNYGYYKFGGSASNALTDNLAGRITAAVTSRDGTVDNVLTGDDINDADDKSVRGELLYKPSDTLSLLLSADYSTEKLHCCVDLLDAVVDHYDDGTPIANGFYARAEHVGYTPLPIDAFARRTDIDSPQDYSTRQSGFSAKLDWELASGHTLTSITAYRRWSFDPHNDLDLTAVPVLTQGAFFSKSHTFTQEVRFASPSDQPIEYMLGIFYMRDTLNSRTVQSFGSGAGGWILPALPLALATPALDGFSGIGSDQVKTRSLAEFAQATWHVNDRWNLTAGLRYTDEKKSGYSEQSSLGGIPLSAFDPSLQPLIAGIRAASAPTFDTRTIEGFPQSHSEGDLSGTLSAGYRFSDTVNGYATYSRGYKSGGINFGVNVPAESTIIEPETADDYELGIKTSLLDHRLALNAAVFWTDVKNYQSTRIFTSAAGATTIYVASVPKIRSRGVELDATYFSGHGLMLNASLAYTDAFYVSDPVDQCPLVNATGLCDQTGKQLPNVSKWAAYLGGSYDLPYVVGHLWGGEVHPFVRANLSYRSDFRSAASEATRVPSYTIADLSFGFKLDDRSSEISFWVHNLFDKDYYLSRTQLIFNNGAIQARVGDPRTYGVTFRQQF